MTYLRRGFALAARLVARNGPARAASRASSEAVRCIGARERQHVRTEQEPDTPWQVHFVRMPFDIAWILDNVW